MYSSSQQTSLIGLPLIVLMALLTALDAMAIDMYLPGMPMIAIDFAVSPGKMQQTLSVFLAGLAIGQGLYGPLLDRFGRRLPLLIGVGIFVLGSVMAALANSIECLLLARFLQALGAAAGLVTPRAIVADLCNLAESARIFSMLMQVMMIGPILAPLIGGFLLGHGGWRFIFWVLAGLAFAGLLWGLRSIPDSLPPQRRVALNVSNILRAYGRQISHRIFMAYTVACGVILGAFFVYISTSAFIFTEHFGLSPVAFSYLFAANSICLVLGGFVSNYLLRLKISAKRIALSGMLLNGLAGLSLFLITHWSEPTLLLYVSLLAFSMGALGLVFGNITALTMNHAGTQAGVASALMGMLHYLVAAIIGYVVSLMHQDAALLPMIIAISAGIALLLYYFAIQEEAVVARQTDHGK